MTDVATVVDSAENTRLGAWSGVDGQLTPSIILNVQRQPGANVIATVDAIKKRLPELQAGLPATLDVKVLSDRTTGIRASVKHVEIELLLAVLMVVLVIFFFLHSLRATVIASLAVPISLIGTCGLMYLMGYSLNNLSLMALTIATGFVVDDAIVMIENISRYLEEGEKPFAAAIKGAAQIGFTIISLTVSLIAVLIPLLFMGDVVGRLFREFAVTLAITILISAVVSLTLVPMMSARWLKSEPHNATRGLAGKVQAFFDRVIARYDIWLQWVFRRQGLTLIVALATMALTVLLYVVIPKGLFPTQDTGQLQGRIEAAQDVSYARMAELQQAAARAILADPEVEPEFVHRCRCGEQHDVEHRPHADQPQGRSRRTGSDDEPVAPARVAGGRRHALPAADAGPDHRRRDRADRIPLLHRRRRFGDGDAVGEQDARATRHRERSAQRDQRCGCAGPVGVCRHRPGNGFSAGDHGERGR